jgi:hypothetical protein
MSSNSSVVAYAFVAAGVCLLSHFLATVREIQTQSKVISKAYFYLFIFQKREIRLKTFGLAYTYTVI